MNRQKTVSLPFYSIPKILPDSAFSDEDLIPVQIEDWVLETLSGDDHGGKRPFRRTTIRGVGPRCGQEKGEESRSEDDRRGYKPTSWSRERGRNPSIAKVAHGVDPHPRDDCRLPLQRKSGFERSKI